MSGPVSGSSTRRNETSEALRLAWRSFCDQLQRAGERALDENGLEQEADQATGLRYLSRNISLALLFHLENNDPRHPEVMRYFDPIRKQGGDNADAVYLGMPVNGRDHFVVRGQRGNARFLAFTLLEDGQTPWGGPVVGSLFGPDLVCDEQGNFELHLAPRPVPDAPNYLATTPDSWRLTIRQFFADWEHEQPMSVTVSNVDCHDPPPPLPAGKVEQGLASAGHWLGWSTEYWAEKLAQWRARPNQFISWHEMEKRAIDATPGGTPLICYWQVARGQALVVRVHPPQCSYWNCEFGNRWFETMDYRYRLAGTNCHHAQLEEDGELIVVISHEDPGLPNWLDPSGHESGYVTFRWMGAQEAPHPHCQQVSMAALAQTLPAGVRKISPSQRQAQLKARRRGVHQRFRL